MPGWEASLNAKHDTNGDDFNTGYDRNIDIEVMEPKGNTEDWIGSYYCKYVFA